MRINTLLNDDVPMSTPAPSKSGRGNASRSKAGTGGPRSFRSKLDANALQDGQSPSGNAPTFSGPHGFYLPLNGSDPAHKRTRPLTQHQLAVEHYRRRRVDVILDRGLRFAYKDAAKRRRKANTFMRAWIRCKGMADGYDTDEDTTHPNASEEHSTSTPPPMPAGLVPLDFGGEVNDHGEESYYRAKMLSRALRRLDHWENGKSGSGLRRARYNDEIDDGTDDDDEDMLDAVDERGEEMDTDDEDEEMERYEAAGALSGLSRVGA